MKPMKKRMLDLKVVANERLHSKYYLLKFTADDPLPEMIPGQFVQVRVEGSPSTFLRRPLSVNYVDKAANEMWLLVQVVGEGTKRMAAYQPGDYVNMLLPLGNGFSMPQLPVDAKILLIGGGVGTAPLLFLGDTLKSIGYRPEFLIGARTKDDLVMLSAFEKKGQTYLTTEDGSVGEKGFVTHHSILSRQAFDQIYTCGPQQMMVAVVRYAKASDIPCEVSLENMMACGFGTCLCCIEKTVHGNVCVCTEGPVFNMNQLTWQI